MHNLYELHEGLDFSAKTIKFIIENGGKCETSVFVFLVAGSQ